MADTAPFVMRPRLVYLLLVAAAAAVGYIVVGLLGGFDLVGLIVVVVAIVAAAWLFQTVKVSPEGVRQMGRFLPWSEATIQSKRLGEVLRSPAGAKGRTRFGMWLWAYDSDWRTGPLGAVIGEVRPDLLTPQHRSPSA